MDIALKYGCNPHQTPAGVTVPEESGFQVLSGRPGYINILDALGAWQLVRELKAATGKPAAASFKHVSPAGRRGRRRLSDAYRASQFLGDDDLSPVATAYARARGGDRMCSFGDVAAVSDVVDVSLARMLFDEVSDLIIAPGFEPEALELLKTKRDGAYMVLQIDPDYEPPTSRRARSSASPCSQKRNTTPDHAGPASTKARLAPARAAAGRRARDADRGDRSPSSTRSPTPSCLAYDGQVIGMGAGQQSRVHCTRLACGKADKWLLQQHPKTLALPDQGRPAQAREGQHRRPVPALGRALRRREAQAARGPRQPTPSRSRREERADWVQAVRRHLPVLRRLHPVPRQPRPRRQEPRAVRRPDRRLRARRRGHRGRRSEYGMTMVHTGLRLFLH